MSLICAVDVSGEAARPRSFGGGNRLAVGVVSRGAECRIRKDRPPGSMRLKRKATAWDDGFLASLVAE